MRILFLTFQFPYPPDNGARIKTLSILDYLRPRHDVSVRCLTRRAPDEAQRRWAAAFGDVRWVRLDRGRNPLNLVRSYLSGVPLSVERNGSAEMSRLVAATLSEADYDVVFVDGWLMAQYLPEDFAGRKVLHEHNAEYVMWERQARLERGGLRRALVEREARRVRDYEAATLRRFDVVLAVSERDREALIMAGTVPADTVVLPNLPDPALLDLPAPSFEASSPEILYFGTLSWRPNIDGLVRFIFQSLPLVRRQVGQARLIVAGRDAPLSLQVVLGERGDVDFLGPVEDSEELYRRARVFVEATQSGGGTKLKVLNALARGLPVVASREGAEGIEAVDGEYILIADDQEALAEHVVRVLTDPVLWKKLSENGRGLVREKYQAETAFRELDEVLSGDRSRI